MQSAPSPTPRNALPRSVPFLTTQKALRTITPCASATRPTSNSAGNKKQNAGPCGPRDVISKPVRLAEAPLSAAATVSATATTATRTCARSRTRLHRQQAFALHLLARQLSSPADRFRLFPRLLFRWFFVVAAELHLAENALTLHLLFQRLEGLVDIVVANENLHACSFVVARSG